MFVLPGIRTFLYNDGMPELPEVETVVRGLTPRITGKEISEIRLLCPRLLRRTKDRDLVSLRGARIQGVRRRGKILLLELSEGWTLAFHLKMTGQLLLVPRGTVVDKHVRLRIVFKKEDSELRFRDVRRFGFLLCLGGDAALSAPELDRLGPEPLSVDLRRFADLLRNRRGRIKSILLDQTFVAGIGNIYADEILFRARIHPLTPADRLMNDDISSLRRSMRAVLHQAIAKRGSTIRDFADSDGAPGEFQGRHRVYGREGEACLSCETPVARIRIGGRSSFFCPKCQTEID